MTESADQPLLTATPAKKPRRAAAKAAPATASAPKASPAEAEPTRKRAVKKKTPAAGEELPGLEVEAAAAPSRKRPVKAPAAVEGEPAKPARRRRVAEVAKSTPAPVSAAPLPPVPPAPASPPPRAQAPAAEEWSPSRPAAPAPARDHRDGGPAASREAPGGEAEPAPARKYPVYIPRHVAKQMEEQGQTAPIAVPADAIPEAARAAVEAAQQHAAAHPSPGGAPARPDHGERREREARDPRFDRHDRHRRGRQDRPERGDRGERGERPERSEGGAERFDRGDEAARYTEQPLGEVLGENEGIVEISGKGFGFIRDAKRGFNQHPQDIFVTPEQVRRYNLRDGQWIRGVTRRGGRGAQLGQLLEINGSEPEKARTLPAFDELTVISPMERIVLETTSERNTTRIIDLFAPIGKGQRGIIVAPPRTGKTTLLQHIADAVVKKHPDIKLIILLIDERPEEVTDIRRTVSTAEVMASSNDSDVKSHTRVAQLAIERAKRLVESGHDVFILLDSITRVGRAFNNAMAGGRTGSGGLDNRALEIPRRLFAAARNTEEAGSLTIIATALIETGSLMDDRIFQEFKGTGNMELVLDRKISEQRIYPAIDIFQSGTRREELLIPADDLHKINLIRRGLAGHKPMEAIERLLFFLKKFPTNAQMLAGIPG